MIRLHGDPPTHLTFDGLAGLGVAHASTTRHCPGVLRSRVPASPLGPDAAAALDGIGLDLSRVAFASQVHGAEARRVEQGGHAGAADILVTATPGLPLAVSTADCLALILVDPGQRVLALAHVGWRGTLKRAAARAVDALVGLGGAPENLVVAIGPSIGPCCYEVDAPVIDPLSRAFPARWRQWVVPVRGGRWRLDLWTANEAQLVDAGCRPDRIQNPRLCTACRRDLFFSYRREGPTGRLVTVAALPAGGAV